MLALRCLSALYTNAAKECDNLVRKLLAVIHRKPRYWCGKTRWCGYPMVKKTDDMFTRFDRMYECDRRTPHNSTSRRDVRNRFLKISVRFLKKTRIRFGVSLVRCGSNKRFSSDIIVIYISSNSKYYSDNG